MKNIENNKLIAEFIDNRTTAENLMFDFSWDWLMPVIDKIEVGLSNDQQEFRVVILEDEVSITQKYRNGVLLKDFEVIVQVDSDGSTKLQNTYKAVVQFINWYNKNE